MLRASVSVHSLPKDHFTMDPLAKRLWEVRVWEGCVLLNDEGVTVAAAVSGGVTLNTKHSFLHTGGSPPS